ncbi:MAG: asparagine synthase (glutamine-hydrolyzing) [Pirellulales bacterium]|nr:asparagine synthase (glutamine-hydrolyzing) [Pirellulales bacterium]
MYRDVARPVAPGVLEAMGRAIAHRGPDGEGFFRADGFGMAHRRLAIIDLDGGAQPMGNEDGSVQVVLNGEIYNFQEVRQGLEARGHRFRTRSDTEVLVHLYEDEGEELVSRLRGMFAFALWDARKRRLLLARDRVGLKPLYVYRDAEKLVFGSELKAILAHPEIDRAIDPAAVDEYLALGMIGGDRSIFRRVRKLPAAHVLSVTADSLDRGPRRFWQFRVQADPARSLAAWCEAVDAKITETVRAHRIADVPVGAFLSGGLDSSAMVAVQSGLDDEPVRTFSIGFREAAFSELPQARAVARRFGTLHREQVVTPEAVQSLEDLVHYYDEPFADASAVPTLLVSRLARQEVKVVLSGDGGDEAFGGYRRYAHDLGEAWLRRRLPRWLRRGPVAAAARWWPKADWLPRLLRAKTLLANLASEPAQAYANTLALCRLPLRHELLAEDVWAALDGRDPSRWIAEPYGAAPADDPLAGMIAADVATLLPDDFLTKVDRASMSCGLEVRPPLVDHELLELAATIPSQYKVRRGQTKWLMKRLFRDRLPEGIADRAKQGFEMPIDRWLRGPLRDVFESTVLSPTSRVAELVNQQAVRRVYRAHVAKVGRHGNVLWSLLVLARWADTYLPPSRVDGGASSAPAAASRSGGDVG